MTDSTDDYKNLMAQKRFLGEIEQGIRVANREIIHKQIPELTTDRILNFAVAVGRLRANYLEAVFNMSVGEHGDPPAGEVIEDIRRQREMYEEARTGFEALVDAIEKGYIDAARVSANDEA